MKEKNCRHSDLMFHFFQEKLPDKNSHKAFAFVLKNGIRDPSFFLKCQLQRENIML